MTTGEAMHEEHTPAGWAAAGVRRMERNRASVAVLPLDLDLIPNLDARLREAGLIWPPTQTVDWPLEDW